MRQMSLARLAAGWLLGLLLLLLCLKLDGVMDSWVWCAGRLTNYLPYLLPHPLLSVRSSCRSFVASGLYLLTITLTHHSSLTPC